MRLRGSDGIKTPQNITVCVVLSLAQKSSEPSGWRKVGFDA